MTPTETEAREIRIVEHLPHSPARVWRALTEPERIARWLMPNDFKLEVGHRFTMRGQPIPAVRFDGVVHCEVLAFEPERMLRYRWCDPGTENGLDSVVTWTLEPADGGTRLTLVHEGFDPANAYQRLGRGFMSSGWVSVIRRLGEEAGVVVLV